MSETDRETPERGGTGPLKGEGVSQAKGRAIGSAYRVLLIVTNVAKMAGFQT